MEFCRPEEYHALVWKNPGKLRDLGTLPGDVESVAYGINNLGQVVRYSKSENSGEYAVM
jgi:uncharacterized membrane protein